MSFFNKMINTELEEKFFRRTIIIGALFIILILIIVFLNFGIIKNYIVPNDFKTGNDGSFEYKIDSIQTGRKYIEIKGWAYKTGQNIGYFNSRYVIRNEETKKMKVLKTEMQITDSFFAVDDKYDCRRAGMYAKSLALGVKEGLYQIFIEYGNDGEKTLFDTGILFNFGQ